MPDSDSPGDSLRSWPPRTVVQRQYSGTAGSSSAAALRLSKLAPLRATAVPAVHRDAGHSPKGGLGWNTYRVVGRSSVCGCGGDSAPGPHLWPMEKTVRLKPHGAPRREATALRTPIDCPGRPPPTSRGIPAHGLCTANSRRIAARTSVHRAAGFVICGGRGRAQRRLRAEGLSHRRVRQSWLRIVGDRYACCSRSHRSRHSATSFGRTAVCLESGLRGRVPPCCCRNASWRARTPARNAGPSAT